MNVESIKIAARLSSKLDTVDERLLSVDSINLEDEMICKVDHNWIEVTHIQDRINLKDFLIDVLIKQKEAIIKEIKELN